MQNFLCKLFVYFDTEIESSLKVMIGVKISINYSEFAAAYKYTGWKYTTQNKLRGQFGKHAHSFEPKNAQTMTINENMTL